MDDCPISFGLKVPLLHRPTYASSSWTHSTPDVTLDVVFDEDMDTTVVPVFGSFEATNGTTPRTLTIIGWQDVRTLRMTFSEGPTPPPSVTIEQLVPDAGCRSTDLELTAPWGPFTSTPP